MTPELNAWAVRWGIPPVALGELAALFGLDGAHFIPPEVKGDSEAAISAAIRLEAARKGVRLFRNNVGVLMDATGRPVRYGLANDSKQVNEVCKSGDLIGWRPVLIGPEHVGTVIARFVSRECKRKGWRYTGDERERAQLAWAMMVTLGGGDACFAAGVGTL